LVILVSLVVNWPLHRLLRGVVLVAVMVDAAAAGALCIGDCDLDNRVAVEEAVQGVAIALGGVPLTQCPGFDADGNARVGVNELVAAVHNALHGCPTATATQSPSSSATNTATPTPTDTLTVTPTDTPSPTPTGPTPTPTINLPPILPTASIYRGYPGFDIRVPIGASDPQGGAVLCSATDLPAGAAFDQPTGTLSWTPAGDQLGPFYVPFSCADDAAPPLSSAGQLHLRSRRSTSARCRPATPRPAARRRCRRSARAAAAWAGDARRRAGGRLRRARAVRRPGRHVRPHAELRQHAAGELQAVGCRGAIPCRARCMKTDTRVRLRARMESNSPNRPVVFDVESRQFFLSEEGRTASHASDLRFPIEGVGPFSIFTTPRPISP
jgi:hypothetical protein